MVRRRSGGSATAADSTLTEDAGPAAEARAGSAATAVAVAEPAAGAEDAEAVGADVAGGTVSGWAPADETATELVEEGAARGTVAESADRAAVEEDAAAAAGKVAEPTGKDAAPAGKPALLVEKAAAPTGKVAAPAGKDTALAGKAAALAGKDAAPAEKVAPPTGKAAAPAGKAKPPAGKLAQEQENVAGVAVGERATAAKAGSDRGHRGPAGPAGAGRQPAPARRPVLVAAVVLALVAALAAAWTGWSWYGAAHDGDADYARARDTVLAAGEQAVQNMNTLNHSDLGHGLDVWEASTTGDLHTQLVQGRADFVKQVQLAQTDSTAKVLSGAVTELDTRAGKASVMVALQITVQAPKSKPSVKESRLVAELTRTAAGWKLSALGQAPMGDSAASGDGSSTGSTAAPGTSASTAPAAPTTKPSTSGR